MGVMLLRIEGSLESDKEAIGKDHQTFVEDVNI